MRDKTSFVKEIKYITEAKTMTGVIRRATRTVPVILDKFEYILQNSASFGYFMTTCHCCNSDDVFTYFVYNVTRLTSKNKNKLGERIVNHGDKNILTYCRQCGRLYSRRVWLAYDETVFSKPDWVDTISTEDFDRIRAGEIRNYPPHYVAIAAIENVQTCGGVYIITSFEKRKSHIRFLLYNSNIAMSTEYNESIADVQKIFAEILDADAK